MLKISICDDNDFQRAILKDLLSEYSESRNCPMELNVYADGKLLLTAVQGGTSADVYILDMVMPGMNGMEVATTLRLMKDGGKIIFLTSTMEYAVASYEVEAFYYMLKPVDREKLFRLLDRAMENMDRSDSMEIKTWKGDVRLHRGDIMFVDLESRRLRYHLRDGRLIEGLTIRVPFKEAVAPLTRDPMMVICGLSLVINAKEIDLVDPESVLLRDGTLLYPSKAACASLKRTLKELKEA